MNSEELLQTQDKAQRLWQTFNRCSNLMHRSFHATHPHVSHDQQPPGQGRLLVLLAEHEPISQRDLAGLMQIRPASLCELLSKLEKNGHISRHAQEQDRRSMVVSLTEQGRLLADLTRQDRRLYADSLFKVLDAEERATLQTLLDKLCTSLQTRFPDNSDDPNA